MTSPDSDTEAEFVQFVCFRTDGPVPVDLFQQSWIPFAEEFFARGIKTMILSEKLPLSGDLSPYKFIAKSYWASITAVKLTFEKGLPSPSSKGHITASQGGIFKLVHTAKGETNAKHNVIYKVGFKAFTMIPTLEESLTKEKVLDYADYLHGLKGFETLAVYKLHECSGPIKEWHYDWIIEAFYNSVSVTEESILKDLINCPMVDKTWELSIHKDYIQMTA
ncbi:uncharacterized protein [Porites lutea]|uniref:uncharacterized protein n=1 Tax=Porites lutea TaxID=51062 RepID=UPI003CC582A0